MHGRRYAVSECPLVIYVIVSVSFLVFLKARLHFQFSLRFSSSDGWVMNVQMTTDDVKYTRYIHNSSTRSHASEKETRTRNPSKNWKCKRALTHLCQALKITRKNILQGSQAEKKIGFSLTRKKIYCTKNCPLPFPFKNLMVRPSHCHWSLTQFLYYRCLHLRIRMNTCR
jgi:hypothetical protein